MMATTTFPAHEIRAPFIAPRRRIRVLTLTPFYPSRQDPTQGRFVAEPLAFLEQFGVVNSTVAVQPFYRGAFRPTGAQPATWMRYFSFPGNVGLSTAGEFLAKRLPSCYDLAEFDLIHAHSALACGHAAALLSKRLSIPFVVTVHGLDAFFAQQCGTIMGRWCARAAEDVYRSAEAVICISERVRQEVERRVNTKTEVIYNGVNASLFCPHSAPNDGTRILSVGNLIPIKGHALLLRAFANIAHHRPECVLEIVGDGPKAGKLARLAADLRITERVQFYGRKSTEFVAEAMRRCSIFALTSTSEGLGCVYLEAMASGKPVVACRGQGIAEIIQHGANGMLVDPENERELVNVLELLLQDGALRQRMGAAARRHVAEEYTIERQAEQLAEVYSRCVA